MKPVRITVPTGAVDDPDQLSVFAGTSSAYSSALQKTRRYSGASEATPPFTFVVVQPSLEHEERLMTELQALRREVREMSDALAAIRTRLDAVGPAVDETAVREVSQEVAVAEVSGYLQREGTAYPSDIAEALALDYDLVVAILGDLERDGRITLGEQ